MAIWPVLGPSGGSSLNQAVPTLEDLRGSPDPAWLWDPARMRVVWGNPPGITYFGGETVFDLLDRPFDTVEPGVEQIVGLGSTLKRGEERRVFLQFPSSGNEAPLSCRCFVHSLSDGRPGLLVVASADRSSEAAKPGALAQ